jgi:hypothetical protein
MVVVVLKSLSLKNRNLLKRPQNNQTQKILKNKGKQK